MRGRSKILAACFMTLSAAALGCGGGGGGGGGAACDELTGYHASVTTPLSFATDVYPILANTSATTGGCAQASICHGDGTPFPINMAGTKTLQFLYGTETAPMMDPAMAKAQLLMASVNAPSMQRVVPSNVGQSVLAYKISGKDGLACIKNSCSAGASVGTAPCGDPMPSIGTLAAADRTKILDWIATGAAD